MIVLIIIQYSFGGGIGGYTGVDGVLNLSLNFEKKVSPSIKMGTMLTMSMTGNAPTHYDIPFYNWGDPQEYPEEYFKEYKERNEVAAQFVAKKYLKNFILMGSTGFSMQEYITLPIPDTLQALPQYPIGERDAYYFVFGGGMGVKIGKFDLCLNYSNRFGVLFSFVREFGSATDKKTEEDNLD